ncbi:MAG: amidohydrolase family protein [Bacteroidia bacterium]|nr:amidohydrolase family protein [Bacteroidia bacterium]
MKTRYWLVLLCTLFIVQLDAQKVYPDKKYALINAQVVNVVTETITSASVLVNQGKIEDIGTFDTSELSGYEIIDLENSYLLPGMIDVHTHLNNLEAAGRALISGVTTVRSASVPAYQDVSISRMVIEGHLEGPDMIPCGVYVTPFLKNTILADPRLGILKDTVDSEEELRHLVRINIDRGAQVIKTRGTERAGLPTTDPRKQTFTTEQLQWIVDEAAKYDVPVIIHGHGDEGSRAAVEAGARSIEHGTFLSDETLELMKAKDAFLVPTFITLLDLVEPGGDYDDPVIHMRGKYMVPKSERTIKAAMRIGVKIATGADNRYTEKSTSRVSMEVEEYRRLGMEPWDALRTTTTNAAELLRIEDYTGKIAAGFEADLIAIPDNPIEDPKALQDVLMVMSNGNLSLLRLPFGKE